MQNFQIYLNTLTQLIGRNIHIAENIVMILSNDLELIVQELDKYT